MLNLTNILAAGGVLAIFTGPAAVWALIGTYVRCSRLEQRNAAQAQTIAGLQARLNRRGDFVPWPRDGDTKLREPIQTPAAGLTRAERQRFADRVQNDRAQTGKAIYAVPRGDSLTYILCTDATCRTAIKPELQAELDAFHVRMDGKPVFNLQPVGDVIPFDALAKDFPLIATTDATLLTAVDQAQQAELDRFHAANAGIR